MTSRNPLVLNEDFFRLFLRAFMSVLSFRHGRPAYIERSLAMQTVCDNIIIFIYTDLIQTIYLIFARN